MRSLAKPMPKNAKSPLPDKGPVIIYRLSGGGGGREGGGAEDFRADHLIFRRSKEGISSNLEPKSGITENFARIQGGTTKICLENEDLGDRESHQMLLRGITSVK